MNYSSYLEFDKATGFSAKAKFQLTKLQITDVEKFVTWDKSLNTYEVGGGKTVVSTVIALMRGNSQILVLVPPVLLTSWIRWLRLVDTNVLLYKGTPKDRKEFNLKAAKWIVMSHAIFRIDYRRISAELTEDLEIIVDEAQNLKNPSSVLFKKVESLCRGI